jgi:hypothetical protein
MIKTLHFKPQLLLFAVMFFAAGVQAQNIIFKLTDGSTPTYALSETRKIFFDGDAMVLLKKDGTPIVNKINTIRNFRYDASTAVREFSVSGGSVKIFPNPFRSVVTIRYDLRVADKVQIDILDLQGRIIRNWPLAQQKAGLHEMQWQAGDANGRAVPSGTYICRIKTSSGIISKMMVLE